MTSKCDFSNLSGPVEESKESQFFVIFAIDDTVFIYEND